MDVSQPRGSIKPQTLSNTPITGDSTLVNDGVALVNDPKALVGSQTTPIPTLRSGSNSNAPKGKIQQRH